MKKINSGSILPLSDLKPGSAGLVVKLAGPGGDHLRKLMAFGVLPGSPISLLRRDPAFVFQIGQTQLAVDISLARQILVETAGSKQRN